MIVSLHSPTLFTSIQFFFVRVCNHLDFYHCIYFHQDQWIWSIVPVNRSPMVEMGNDICLQMRRMLSKKSRTRYDHQDTSDRILRSFVNTSSITQTHSPKSKDIPPRIVRHVCISIQCSSLLFLTFKDTEEHENFPDQVNKSSSMIYDDQIFNEEMDACPAILDNTIRDQEDSIHSSPSSLSITETRFLYVVSTISIDVFPSSLNHAAQLNRFVIHSTILLQRKNDSP